MLRITVHDNPQALTFQLEGRLTGPWLREFDECWQSTLARQRTPIVRVDLTGVTLIDDAGKACLAAIHLQGAEFVAADCETKAIVAEITRSPLPEGSGLTRQPITINQAEKECNREHDSRQECSRLSYLDRSHAGP